MCYNITNAINNEYMECFYDYLKYFCLEMVENNNKLSYNKPVGTWEQH